MRYINFKNYSQKNLGTYTGAKQFSQPDDLDVKYFGLTSVFSARE